MKLLYPECKDCVAKPFCGKLSGAVTQDTTRDWCAENKRLYRALEMSLLPQEYLYANIYNYKIDDYNKDAYEKLKPIVENVVEAVDKGINILITGTECGTGKTYNAAVIFNHYIYKTCLTRFDYERPVAIFVEYAQLMNDLRNFDDNEEAQELFETIKSVPLLLIDDIGAGILSRFTREQTYLLLNYRFNNRLSTIVTSNFSPVVLKSEEYLGARNVSRLSRNSLWIELNGKDRRGSRYRD